MSRPVTVLGSANVDFIMKIPHLPARGESVGGGEFFQVLGGKGANQAVAAARAGAATRFVACVGGDVFGEQMAGAFAAEGIDVSALGRAPDVASGAALIMIDAAGMNYLSVAPGANGRLTPAHVAAARGLIASAGILMLQREVPAETNRAALETARASGVTTMLNYAPVQDADPGSLSLVDVLVVNETEAAALARAPVSDAATAAAAAERLAALGPRRVIVTLGGDGALACDAGRTFAVPAFPVAAVDTTAAGDTFCGALAAALVEGRELAAALRFAAAAAALCVTRIGAQPSIPRRAEIEAFLAGRE